MQDKVDAFATKRRENELRAQRNEQKEAERVRIEEKRLLAEGGRASANRRKAAAG